MNKIRFEKKDFYKKRFDNVNEKLKPKIFNIESIIIEEPFKYPKEKRNIEGSKTPKEFWENISDDVIIEYASYIENNVIEETITVESAENFLKKDFKLHLVTLRYSMEVDPNQAKKFETIINSLKSVKKQND